MIDKQEIFQKLNDGIKAERLRVFKRNLKKNRYFIQQFGGLRPVIDSFEGKYVIIIGAGPSVENEMRLLKKFQQRDEFVYIAVDMAVKPLLAHGIVPGFVISCEAKPVNYFKGVDTSGLHLLAFSCISPENLKEWQGKVSFYNWLIDDEDYEQLWEKAGVDLGFLGTGSLVTTQAVSLALGCNVQSVVLIGNDLGFTDRFYLRGVPGYDSYFKKNSRILPVETRESKLVRKNREYEVHRNNMLFYINRQFLGAKLWLEELFERTQVPIIDCSMPGCSEKFVQKIAISDFFKYFDRKKTRKAKKRRK